jgi:hypothetical protein
MTKYERLYTADEVDGMIARAKAAAAQPAPVQEPVKAIHIGWDYLDCGQLVATYAVPVKEQTAPHLYTTHTSTPPHPEQEPVDKLPSGFVPLQKQNNRIVYAACMDSNAMHYKWLMWRHPDGQWVSKRKLENWEVMQVEDQEHYGIVQDKYDPNSCSYCGMVGGHVKTCRLYTTPPAAAPVPEGWKLVPIEPTEAMCLAGVNAGTEYMNAPAHIAYKAMLAAAPVQRELVQKPDAFALRTKKHGLEFNSGYGMVKTLEQAKEMQRRHMGNLEIVELRAAPPAAN